MTKKPRLSRSILCLLTVALLGSAAATLAADDRPRVGLVLGGGGARGAAHIGVLQELERLQVPVDVIVGTSMGAIVGGLYASGTSADELDQIVGSLNWSAAMSDRPRRQTLSFRRKQDDIRYPIGLELGVRDGGAVLPKGLVQGQNLDPLLRKLTASTAQIDDFDALPIPFRAVATDIEAGKIHIMGSGDLALSIRASMSVPGVFAPTELDGKVLVDGGVVANLPVAVMQALDVDVIIAVAVDFPLYSPAELDSAPAITEQMLSILMLEETRRQMALLQPTDILIEPALGTFASSDFGNAEFAVGKGVEAVAPVEQRLRELALNDADYAAHLAARRAPTPLPERIDFVRIEHDGRLATELLAARLDVHPGDAIDPDQLAEGANRLYGLDLYEQVSYKIVSEGDQTGVLFDAVGKSWGPDFLNVGISLQDDFDGATAFNLAARLTRTGLNDHGAEWRTDLQLGTELALESEFYQPFGSGLKFFVAPRFSLQQRNQNMFAANQEIAQLRIAEALLGADLGAELGNFGELRLGAYTGNGKSRVKIGDPTLPDNEYDLGAIYTLFRMDTFDLPRFPRTGTAATLRWDWSRRALGADANYETLDFDLLTAWSFGKSTFNAGLSYSTSFDDPLILHEYEPLGGFLNLSGLDLGQISGPHSGVMKLVYYRRLGDYDGGLFDLPVYLGGSLEAGNVWQEQSDINFGSLLFGGSAFIAFDTFVGAIYLAAGFGEGGQRAYYLSIGSPPL